jgi:hypothetical protein
MRGASSRLGNIRALALCFSADLNCFGAITRRTVLKSRR